MSKDPQKQQENQNEMSQNNPPVQQDAYDTINIFAVGKRPLLFASNEHFQEINEEIDGFMKQLYSIGLEAKIMNAHKEYADVFKQFNSAKKNCTEAIEHGTVNDLYYLINSFESLQPSILKLGSVYPEGKEMLDGILKKVRTVLSSDRKLLDLEVENFEKNMSFAKETSLDIERELHQELKEKPEIEALNQIKSSNQSGYGFIYDTVDRYVEVIEQYPNLESLAGPHFNRFKVGLSEYKTLLRSNVDMSKGMTNDTQNELNSIYEQKMLPFLTYISELQSGIFEDLKDVIANEINYIRECHANRAEEQNWKEMMRYQDVEEVEAERTVRDHARNEVENEFRERITSYYSSAVADKLAHSKLRAMLDRFTVEGEVYQKDDKTYTWNDIKDQLNQRSQFTFREFTRQGNAYAPLYAALKLKGYSDETIMDALEHPTEEKNADVLEEMKQSRQQVYEMVLTENPETIADQVAGFYANVAVKYADMFLESMNADDSYVAMAKYCADLEDLQSLLLQGMPRNFYDQNGKEFMQAAIDKKLKEMGKPYNFDTIGTLVNTLGSIATAHLKAGNQENKLELHEVASLNQKFAFWKSQMEQFKENGQYTEQSIASYKLEGYDIEHLIVSENEVNQSVERDLRYAVRQDTPESLLGEVDAAIVRNAASKKFDNIRVALYNITVMERYGADQKYINESYAWLKKACSTYLESRNPWTAEGKARYKLVTKIECMVNDSKRARMNKEQSESPRKQDNTFSNAVNDFLAEVESSFDSQLMKKIKHNVKVASNACRRNMTLPVYGTDHSWYKLFKQCMDYVTDPKKANNRRKVAVDTMLSHIVAMCKDPQIDKLYRMRTRNRDEVFAAMNDYEVKTDRKISDYNKKIKTNDTALSRAKMIAKDAYVDSIFGMEATQIAEMIEKKVLKSSPQEAIIVRNASFEKNGFSREAFSYLALMEFTMNECPLGERNLTTKKFVESPVRSAETIRSKYVFLAHNYDGSEIRERVMVDYSSETNNTIQRSRETIKQMLDNGERKELVSLVAKSLKTMMPGLEVEVSESTEAGYIMYHKMLDTVLADKEIRKEVFNYVDPTSHERLFSDVDVSTMKSIIGYSNASKAVYKANADVMNARTSGVELTDEYKRECYKTILKHGMLKANMQMRKIERDDKKIEEYTKEMNRANRQMIDKKLSEQERETARKRFAEYTDKLNALILKADDKVDNVKDLPVLLGFNGRTEGRKMLDAYIDTLVPKDLSMEQLFTLVDRDDTFYKQECKNALSKLGEKLVEKQASNSEQKQEESPEIKNDKKPEEAAPNQQKQL